MGAGENARSEDIAAKVSMLLWVPSGAFLFLHQPVSFVEYVSEIQ